LNAFNFGRRTARQEHKRIPEAQLPHLATVASKLNVSGTDGRPTKTVGK